MKTRDCCHLAREHQARGVRGYPDGQVIQMSRLLYLTVSTIDDGQRDARQTLTADQDRYLITAKLAPLGIHRMMEHSGPLAD